MSETPVGESPPGGGRKKKWKSEAERVAAYRQRVALDKKAAEDAPPEPVPPTEATTALGLTVAEMQTLIERHRGQFTAIAARVEAALAGIADPDAVAAALTACDSAAAERVAAADARAAEADRRRLEAEHQASDDRRRADEAESAARSMDARLTEVETILVATADELEAERAGRAGDGERAKDYVTQVRASLTGQLEAAAGEHEQAIRQLEERHAADMDQLRAAHVQGVAGLAAQHEYQVDELRRTMADQVRRHDAEQEAAGRAVEASRSEVERLREALRMEQDALPGHQARQRAVLEEVWSARVEAARAEAAGEVARLTGELEGCRAELAGLRRLVEDHGGA